jgi:hypothetical protein
MVDGLGFGDRGLWAVGWLLGSTSVESVNDSGGIRSWAKTFMCRSRHAEKNPWQKYSRSADWQTKILLTTCPCFIQVSAGRVGIGKSRRVAGSSSEPRAAVGIRGGVIAAPKVGCGGAVHCNDFR